MPLIPNPTKSHSALSGPQSQSSKIQKLGSVYAILKVGVREFNYTCENSVYAILKVGVHDISLHLKKLSLCNFESWRARIFYCACEISVYAILKVGVHVISLRLRKLCLCNFKSISPSNNYCSTDDTSYMCDTQTY